MISVFILQELSEGADAAPKASSDSAARCKGPAKKRPKLKVKDSSGCGDGDEDGRSAGPSEDGVGRALAVSASRGLMRHLSIHAEVGVSMCVFGIN